MIGLFQAMFERNILTFNPGWDQNAQSSLLSPTSANYSAILKAQAVRVQQEADGSTNGPAGLLAMDPDGNPILLDRHI